MSLVIAAAQSMSVPGDISRNVAHHLRFGTIAAERGAQLLVFPELISTGDIFVASNVGAFEPAGGFDTWSRTVNIPFSVSYGTEYFLGTIVDYDDRVAERYWSNNATYMARKIRIRSRPECAR